ncbi:hypothetical protein CRG98_047892 [Punica granatum]|uniref:Uncharacterized protein n=1 Tax=Punica granatum TaxID=22663 RepID=A0A2I0HJ33_PUNGR|nr:hypothetical protein CRG98_047892 [Punica granatum]
MYCQHPILVHRLQRGEIVILPPVRELAHGPAPQLTLETRSSILHPNNTCSSTISPFDIYRVGFIFSFPGRRGRVRVGPRPGAQPVASSSPARPNPTWPSPVRPRSNCPLASARLGPRTPAQPGHRGPARPTSRGPVRPNPDLSPASGPAGLFGPISLSSPTSGVFFIF